MFSVDGISGKFKSYEAAVKAANGSRSRVKDLRKSTGKRKAKNLKKQFKSINYEI